MYVDDIAVIVSNTSELRHIFERIDTLFSMVGFRVNRDKMEFSFDVSCSPRPQASA